MDTRIPVQTVRKSTLNTSDANGNTAGKNQQITLNVNGMTCSSCAAGVESTLKNASGVRDAAVNFATERVSISFDPHEVRISELKDLVKKSGYELVEPRIGGDEDADLAKARIAKQRLFYSAILSGTIMLLMMAHMFVRAIPGYLPLVAVLAAPIVFYLGRHVHIAA
ncbi:MAG: cation transporter, partial [Spirochaeta sp.]